MRLYKHYFENTDTQSRKKYRTEWLYEKYTIFLRHKVMKIKLLGLFTIYKLTDNNREEVEKKLQEMIQKDRELVCKNDISCKKTDENTLVKMAKFIMQTGEDYCTKCCVDFKACNELLKGDESKLPPEEVCIRNIINFFENETD